MESGTYKQRQALAYLKRHVMRLPPEIDKRLRKLGFFSRVRDAAKNDIEEAKGIEKRLFDALSTVSPNSAKDFAGWDRTRTEMQLYITTGINANWSRSLDPFVLGCVGAHEIQGSPKRWNDLDTTGLSQAELRAMLYVISQLVVQRQKEIYLFRRTIKVATMAALGLTALVFLLSALSILPW